MRPKQSALREEIARVNRSHAFAEAKRDAPYTAVCLIGYEGRVARFAGDNMGGWPVRIVTSTRPHYVAKQSDLQSPYHRVRVLELVWTDTAAHAKRLKAAIDGLLLGHSNYSTKLRHGWRDVEHEPEIIWPILLAEALRNLAAKRETVPTFDGSEYERRVAARIGRSTRHRK